MTTCEQPVDNIPVIAYFHFPDRKKLWIKQKREGIKMDAIKQVLIPCKISPGMFDNEYAVEISLPTGEIVSLFADKTLIHKVNRETFLRVNMFEDDSGQEQKTVLLPTESFEKGSRWVQMPSSRLAPA